VRNSAIDRTFGPSCRGSSIVCASRHPASIRVQLRERQPSVSSCRWGFNDSRSMVGVVSSWFNEARNPQRGFWSAVMAVETNRLRMSCGPDLERRVVVVPSFAQAVIPAGFGFSCVSVNQVCRRAVGVSMIQEAWWASCRGGSTRRETRKGVLVSRYGR
jgi:hypothetical protein